MCVTKTENNEKRDHCNRRTQIHDCVNTSVLTSLQWERFPVRDTHTKWHGEAGDVHSQHSVQLVYLHGSLRTRVERRKPAVRERMTEHFLHRQPPRQSFSAVLLQPLDILHSKHSKWWPVTRGGEWVSTFLIAYQHIFSVEKLVRYDKI